EPWSRSIARRAHTPTRAAPAACPISTSPTSKASAAGHARDQAHPAPVRVPEFAGDRARVIVWHSFSSERVMPMLTRWLAALVVVTTLATVPARAETERAEIEAIVKDYLAQHPEEVERIVKNYLARNPEVVRDAITELLKRRQLAAPPGIDKSAAIKRNA